MLAFTHNERHTVMAYLWCWTVSMRGDAVHLAGLASGQSPHSTVPFRFVEAICNNNSGIDTMEREEIPVVASSDKKRKGGKKEQEGIHRLPFYLNRCHTEPQNAVRGQWDHYERVQFTQPSVGQIFVGKLAQCARGAWRSLRGQRGV